MANLYVLTGGSISTGNEYTKGDAKCIENWVITGPPTLHIV